ncbi:MAG: hypothetical protein EP326_02050 [Deltaproteobacteria bacterium]|jgi:hypothetical protein|nr:MAG: hypothetical protein EP326_02050 [Deltaproteobacteria bacterium]TNF28794.1 MAG: hypothetical protein EP319_08240 [Deltaproteobacteria bacterium]
MKTSLESEDLSNLNQVQQPLTKDARIKQLQELIETLNQICSNLDPYQPIAPAMKQSIEKLNIVVTDDPFTLTNQLVVLLEDAVEELHSLDSRHE